ncbi:uncharacterized protein LOC136066656 [Quercus suber]|uniref:uncharacterized protein LOC136066656 n=1 Tax=Quercus suber TaxID=58331 RepID=UPI0032DE71E6
MWQAIEIGWTKPKEAPADWDEAKIKAANFNSKALNALYSAVTNKEFKKISLTETTKKAWTILQTTYEGTKAVKDSKLQRLITSFEDIKMEEDESFDEFYAKLKDIVNSAFNFGKTIPEPKIVRKVLRFLLERFHAKITAIEESKDIDKIPLTELVKSSNTDESSDDEDSKMKSYITRQFKKFMKNANGRSFDKDCRQSSSSQFKSQDKGKKDAKDGGQYTAPEGPKCFGCHGFEHMKHECPTYLKSIGKSKALAATLSDTKSEDDSDNEDDGILNAFTATLSEKHEKLYRLATKKLNDVELDREELSTKFDEANRTIGALRFENNFLAKKTKKLEAKLFQIRAQL